VLNLHPALQRVEGADATFQHALQFGLADPVLFSEMGRLYAEAGRLRVAEGCYRRVKALSSDNEQAWAEASVRVGNVLTELNDIAGAVTEYKQVRFAVRLCGSESYVGCSRQWPFPL